jgi:ribosomal protein L37AE/L43A
MPTREDTPRVSIAQVRGQFSPRAYRALEVVRLARDGVVADVRIVGIAAHGSVRGMQRRFACPRCARPVMVVGVVDGEWVCATCGRWRSRDRSREVRNALGTLVGSAVSSGPTCH